MLNIEAFIADVCAGKTNETPSAYRTKLRYLAKYLEGRPLDQGELDRFRADLLARKLSLFTTRTVLATVRHYLRWARERGQLPALELRQVKEPKPQPKAIRQETFERLLEAARITGEDWYQARNVALLMMLRDTGGRVGCLCRLEMGQLMLRDGYGLAPDKGGQLTCLYFQPVTAAALRGWLAVRYLVRPRDDYVFSGAKGKGISRQGMIRMLDRLAEVAGCPQERHNPHSFRHAFARDSLRNGADLSSVSQLMGHQGIVVTAKYYARWTGRELREIHRRYSPLRV